MSSTSVSNPEDVELKPPEHTEPEKSVFPVVPVDPEDLEALQQLLLWGLLIAMSGEGHAPDNQRRFNEYAFTMSLGSKSGTTHGFTYRMRCFLQTMEDGTVKFSNIQLTVKTPGNEEFRIELETDDNLPSMDLKAAFEALQKKYGKDLPPEIKNVKPDDFYVDGVCLNARRGIDVDIPVPVIKVAGITLFSVKARVMVNGDYVMFTPPEILEKDTGEPEIKGIRPEAELEIKSIRAPAILQTLAPRLFEDGGMPLFKMALDYIHPMMAAIFDKTTTHDLSKPEAAKEAALTSSWSDVADRIYMKPSDYTADAMRKALGTFLKLMPEIDTPEELAKRLSKIDAAEPDGNGRVEVPMPGYYIVMKDERPQTAATAATPKPSGLS